MPEADDTIPFVSIKEEEFRASLQKAESPPVADPLLSALWWDAKGDWKRAHECMPIFIAKKATSGMPGIGIVGQGNRIVC
jgi:hypothetical protein